MRFIEFLILFFGLLGMSCKAADQTNTTISSEEYRRLCMRIFEVPTCSLPTLGQTTPAQTTPTPIPAQTTPTPIPAQTTPTPIPAQTTPTPALSCRCVSSDECTQNIISTSSFCQTRGQVCCNDPEPQRCGYRKYPSPRIGHLTDPEANTEAEFAEFPWMVAVLQRSNDDSRPIYICGGTIIHPRAVLTSTHNIRNYRERYTNLIIRAGEWDMSSDNEPMNHQDSRVETIILHEHFDRQSLSNDVGIIILKTAFDLTKSSVGPICLPQGTESIDANSCITSGWGKDRFGDQGRHQSVLKKIKLPVVSHDICQDRLRTRLGGSYKLHKSFMCAGGVINQDSCQGDGGGPLMCLLEDDEIYVQIGIVSWGVECGLEQMPGVYTNVSNVRQWINSKMTQYSLDTTSYEL